MYSPINPVGQRSTNAAESFPMASKCDALSIVLLLPPAPAARVLDGRWFAAFSARSAAAFLRIAVRGPPGAAGDEGRAVVEPVEGELGPFPGDDGRGEDCPGWLAIASVQRNSRISRDSSMPYHCDYASRSRFRQRAAM